MLTVFIFAPKNFETFSGRVMKSKGVGKNEGWRESLSEKDTPPQNQFFFVSPKTFRRTAISGYTGGGGCSKFGSARGG